MKIEFSKDRPLVVERSRKISFFTLCWNFLFAIFCCTPFVFIAVSAQVGEKSTGKRFRTKFTSYQLRRLEEVFMENNYIIGMKRRRVATELFLHEKAVKTWFQNRRVKMRLEQLKNQSVLRPANAAIHSQFDTKVILDKATRFLLTPSRRIKGNLNNALF